MNTYSELDAKLTGCNSQSRKVDNNTYAIRQDGNIVIKLHATNIVTFTPAGDIILNSGGWHTPTTKDRISKFISGWRITQTKGVWYLWNYASGDSYRFADGITIHADGTVTGFEPDDIKADTKLKAKIKKYAQLCADSVPLAKPGPGDCWYCRMQTETGATLGDTTHNNDHLTSHMDEAYVVPSLVYNAMIEAGYKPERNIQFSLVFNDPRSMIDLAKDTVRRSVRRYLSKRFGFAV
jgi:hypothetical protein